LRVLLDAHVSSRHIGSPLATSGHDVLALDQDQALAALADEEVLELASSERRVLITHNVRHFAPLMRSWAEARRSHGGCILVTLPHNAYGPILAGVREAFTARSEQEDWLSRAEFIARSHGSDP
jgi:Domain of unknown function (DUF5615)